MNLEEFQTLKYERKGAMKSYQGLLINRQGQVFKVATQEMIHPHIRKSDGEISFCTWNSEDNGSTEFYVKKAVAWTFGLSIPPELQKHKCLIVAHKDGDKQNNCLNNLCWRSYGEMLSHNQNFANYTYANQVPVVMKDHHHRVLKRFASVLEAGQYLIVKGLSKAKTASGAAGGISAALVGRNGGGNGSAFGYYWQKDW